MRVLLVCDYFLKYTSSYAIALRGQRHDVAVLCRDHAGEFGGDAEERAATLLSLRNAGCLVIEVPGRLRSLASVPDLIGLRKAVAAWEPEIVHVQDNHDPRLALLTGAAPHVLTIHDPTPHLGTHGVQGLRHLFREMWLRRADLVIVHGDELRRRFIAAHDKQRRVEIVPHGADPFPAPLPVPPEPNVVLFGRLEVYKGVGVLLDAMARVWRHRPEVKLTIVGTGPEARLVPNDSRIAFFNGYLPESGVDDLFVRASLAVLPYLEASQSGAGVESLRRGVPTIVTNTGSLPELVHDERLITEPGDAEGLARSIAAALDHDVLFRALVLEHVRSFFAWETIARRTASLYSQVAGSGPRERPLPRLAES
jgi:glycosyltransferase involved in cell wall biosynthesis